MFHVSERLPAHRILDFDIENRPLSYWFADATTAEITAIAWSWVGEDEVHVEVLEPPPHHVSSNERMLTRFLEAYEQADVVTGHYIRKHDLPLVNAACMEHGYTLLGPKLTQDTKLDLVKRGALATSQEALGAMLNLDSPKEHMTQEDWRRANRLTPEGIEETKRRVVGDVVQHKMLREVLVYEGLLKPPSLWRP